MASRAGLVFAVAAIVAAMFIATTRANEYDYTDTGLGVWSDGPELVENALQMDEEPMMESESSPRWQLTGGYSYISYAVLSRNTVPCNRRGRSYYDNCHGHQRANPYRRGCTMVTRCARNSR